VRCPKEIEDQEHEQVLPASGPRSAANAIAENTLRMDLAADPHRGQPPARPSRSPDGAAAG
jgi:hypothetical protein